MARSRVIKPGFFSNEFLGELKFETRLLFAGLWTLADREGRLEDRPKRIKIDVFPWDKVDCDVLLDELARAGFVLRYVVDEVRYLQIVNFAKHQQPHYREAASEIPAPDGHSDTGLGSAASHSTKRKVMARDGYKCLKCGATDRLHVDHIVPGSLGGPGTMDNLQTLCHRCNVAKGNRSSADHRPTIGQPSANIEPSSVNDGASCAPVSVPVSIPVPVSVPDPVSVSGGPSTPSRIGVKRPLRDYPRLAIFPWMLDELLAMLGSSAEEFDLDAYLLRLDASGEVLPAEIWPWLKKRVEAEASARGISAAQAKQGTSYRPTAHADYDRWPEECRKLHGGECGNYNAHQVRMFRDEERQSA